MYNLGVRKPSEIICRKGKVIKENIINLTTSKFKTPE